MIGHGKGLSEDAALVRLMAPLLRWRYPLLVVAAYGFCFQHLRGTGGDWRLFVLGSELLFGVHHPWSPLPGGLHVFANYPEVQIGPLSLLVATPFRILGRTNGRIAVALLCTAIAPASVHVLERAAKAAWRGAEPRSDAMIALTAFFGGLVVVQAWTFLATIYARLDDALLLGALVVAVHAVALRRAWTVGIALGLGMALKPWGIVAFPLVLALPRRHLLRAAGAAVAIAAAAWLPFLIGDPATLEALRPQAATSPASVLGLVGVPTGTDAPPWVRPVQFGAALSLGSLAVRRRRWGALLLIGIALRVGLDPEVFPYYSSGLLLAALGWDLLRSPRPLPVWSFATFLALHVGPLLLPNPSGRAVLRLAITAAVVVGVALGPGRGRPASA